jgi:hypothetical protein
MENCYQRRIGSNLAISDQIRPGRSTVRAPRPLPGWLQAGVVVLLLAQGVLTAVHWSQAHASATRSMAAIQDTSLAQFEYTYQPDNLRVQGAAQTASQARYDYDPYDRSIEKDVGSGLSVLAPDCSSFEPADMPYWLESRRAKGRRCSRVGYDA